MNAETYLRDAFSRNIGLVSEAEQEKLLKARVAVAGAGGVGGLHLLTLARLGLGNFSIADLDTFDTVNINRQFGAMSSTLGKPKAEVLAQMVQDINPYADVRVFEHGVTLDNLDAFLEGVDVYVDGIDFFEIEIRRAIFQRCREKGIYAITSAPLGFGATLQVFSPTGMTFDDYFGIDDEMDFVEKIASFASGLGPQPYHIRYLDLSKVNFANRTGPAVAPACTMAASLIATEVAKIVTGKGTVLAAPHYLQIDLLLGKFKRGFLFMGGKNPLQKLKKWLILRKVRPNPAR
ncbi:ThiF family adenylyltransferase [Geomesophilobacter sediminis]|uniref:ThiF family adenylyltransferase n=1 Tax=Geomesophilobacter sediminis TaxID=2798584 RepID=A0A8J7LXT5_9BACT|nr:ThiF family adenylyltransferase [Geomesophilobacter sediminis]MBJ6723661.1 ThiF family adenylyltransferase [Geomesophilobacter sediminis]